MGRGSSVSIATGYGLGGPGIEFQWGRDFPHLSRPALGVHPASCTVGTGSFPGGKERPGRDADPLPPSTAVVKERVELYLYSRYGPYGLYRASVPVQGCTLWVLYLKTNIHFWSYLAHLFLKWEMFETKIVEKIKTHILCSVTFFWKLCHLWDIVEKYGRSRRATDDDMIRCRTGVICMPGIYGKNTVTHSESVILTVFQWQQLLCEWPSVLHYTYIACFLHYVCWTNLCPCAVKCTVFFQQWNLWRIGLCTVM